MKNSNFIEDLYKRETDRANVYSKYFVENLNLDAELKSHEGCVNCLEWNRSGTLLASGSDDLKIKLWDPFKKTLLATLDTKHRGNIFSVVFLPFTGDSLIASGAADNDIYVHDVNKLTSINEVRVHQGRVKRLTTAWDVPFMFWSCGEDGYVLQHDIRCPKEEITQFLFDFSATQAETKCIAINQARSEMIAVGANDPYARVYDRRMLSTRKFLAGRGNGSTSSSDAGRNRLNQNKTANTASTPIIEFTLNNDNYSKLPVQFYVPGHLPGRVEEYRKRLKTLSVTFLTFSPNGDELLVNLGGEQLYLFDLEQGGDAKFKYDYYRELFDEFETTTRKVESSESSDLSRNSSSENIGAFNKSDESSGEGSNKKSQKKKSKLPQKAEILKSKANTSFGEKNFSEAVGYYNEAIRIAPDSPVLYGNRATALMKRNWAGDVYMALLDSYKALRLDMNNVKSLFRLARCLHELKWHEEARECLEMFCKRNPDYENSEICDNLTRDINSALEAKKKSDEAKKSKKKSTRNLSQLSESSSSSDGNESENDEEKSNEDETAKKKRCDSNNNTSYQKMNAGSSEASLKKLEADYLKAKEDAGDFKLRYCGHCNVATDIKEANFIGEDFIAAGSDDGTLFIWDKKTTNVLRVLNGDESIVNCVQPHPTTCMLATSGIDPHVRLWSPKFKDQEKDKVENDRVVNDFKSTAENNQIQMNSHPFEFLLLNLTQNAQNWETDEESGSGSRQQSVACRPS